MFFIVSGRDKPNNFDARLKFRAQHRAHYEALGEDLLLSGPYLDEKGEPVGSMIIMRRGSQAEADAFANADPYAIEAVFDTLSVARWDWFMNRPAGLAP
jgi:uncharacterized protein YciI